MIAFPDGAVAVAACGRHGFAAGGTDYGGNIHSLSFLDAEFMASDNS